MQNLEYNLPSVVDNTNFRYILVDDKYIKSLIICNITSYIDFLEIIEAIPKDYIFDMVFEVKKQDTMNILKEITYNIGSSSSEIKSSSDNQIDIEILNKVKEDAKNLRKKIQIDNEEVFYVNIIITFFSNNLQDLEYTIKSFQSKIYSKGLISNISNFRNLECYINSLPIVYSQKDFFKSNYLNLTTSSISTIFPFYEKSIFDDNGIIIGFTKNENKICSINIFNEKYLNANMCVLGSSGSGKSYFTKLLILKNYLMGIKQYIFDLEEEYYNVSNKLKLPYIDICTDNYKYNILEIFEYDIVADFFTNKINNVCNFIIDLCGLERNKYYEKIYETIEKTYNEFKIDSNIDSIYQKSDENNILLDKKIIDSCFFPTMKDLIKNITNTKLKNIINDKFIYKYPFFNGITNIFMDCEILIFCTHNIQNNDLGIITNYLIEKILSYNKILSEDNYIIYIDEIWKYINLPDDRSITNKLLELYKSIRKNKGSIVIITQDISDFFKVQNGNLGKVILNNCGFKFFFRIDYADIEVLKNLSVMDKEEIKQILSLDKGQALFTFKNSKTILNIKASEFEKDILGG